MSHSSSKLRRLVAVTIALPVAFAAAGPALADPHNHAPLAGRRRIGDPLFPALGNGGYDALHYYARPALRRPRRRSRRSAAR